MPTQNLRDLQRKKEQIGTEDKEGKRRKRERIQKPKKVRNNMPTQNLRYKGKDGKKEEIRNLRRKIGERNLNMQKARGKRPRGEKERENPRKCGTICPRRVLDRVHGIEK